MATPAYSTDLTDISLGESTSGYSALGGGSAGLSASPDLSMQGSNCVDKSVTNANKGMMYNAGAVSPGANDHIFTWLFVATPGLTDALAAEGVVVAIGTSTGNYNAFHVGGNDQYGAGGRVGLCYAVRYQASANGSVPYRTNYGSPGATPSYFGAKIKTTASVKGANLGLDAIRYGTGIYITAGDGGSPATFAGAAAANDTIANRWGVLTQIGKNFELQGRLVFGQNTAGTPVAAHSIIDGALVAFIDTPHSLTDFTQVIVDHASTIIDWKNITFQALGTNNPGRLVFNNAATAALIDACKFDEIGITTLRAGVAVTNTTWQATDQVTLNSATIDGCVIAANSATSAVVTDDLGDITGCSFTSAGTGHAVELTSIGGGTMTWDNSDTGYAASDGSTGNETIYVAVGSGTLTVNVAAGATEPTIRTAGATVNVVTGQTTLTVTGVPSGAEWRLYVKDPTEGTIGTTELDGAETHGGGDITYAYTYAADQGVALQVIADGFEEFLVYFTLKNSDQTQTPILKAEENT